MNLAKERFYRFFRKHAYPVLGGAFLMLFITAIAHGLGYNVIGFWFLAITNWVALFFYFSERRRAEKRQQEINRYRKNRVKI